MLNNENHKNIVIYILIAFVLLLSGLLYNKGNKSIPTDTDTTEDIANIIIDSEPFNIPEDFKKFLISKKILSMTFGDENGDIRLVSIDGKIINPCLNRIKDKKNPDGITSTPCKFASSLGEAHMVIAKLSGAANGANQCGVCSVNEVTLPCKIQTNTYSCKKRKGECAETACGGAQ